MEFFDITIITAIVVIACIVLFSTYIVPILKEKWGEAKFNRIWRWVQIAVGAVEQIYTESGMGPKKKEEAIAFLRKMGITVDFEELSFLIEKAVYEINAGKTNGTKMLPEQEKVA